MPTRTTPTTRRTRTRAAAGSRLVGCAALLAVLAAEAVGANLPKDRREALARLGRLEERLRDGKRRGATRPWTRISGADPIAVEPLPDGERFIGLLAGESAVVLLDSEARELSRLPAPARPSGLYVAPSGEVVVVGEEASRVARYRNEGRDLSELPGLELEGVHGLRDVVVAAGRLYAIDRAGGRIVVAEDTAQNAADDGRVIARELAPCRGGIAIDVVDVEHGPLLIADCLLEHALVVRDLDGREIARVAHHGPFWSMAAARAPDGALLLASGGVEDRPLDRSEGFFGSIDSFVYLDRIDGETVQRLAAVNVSDLGVITPKWVELRLGGGGVEVAVAGYGSDRLAVLSWQGSVRGPPRVAARAVPPGTTDIAGPIAANPLLDAWVVLGEGQSRVRLLADREPRSPAMRIGEVLFFTTLLAPSASSEGRRSRFTCETCHHEGGIDGRTHWTGRGEVYATTKPLFGLLANRPFFSRALDPTMTRMVDNEFRVANRGSGEPWFSVRPSDRPWLAAIDPLPAELSAEWLRGAFIEFLAAHEPATNPRVRGRDRFTPLEAGGADLFRERCEGCHAARLVADEAASRVAFSEWEGRIFGGGPILWGRIGYERTEITPYVHPAGARVPALRRVVDKWPYFTNGSAGSLEDVLERASWGDGRFSHAAAEDAPASERLNAAERRALLAFLSLL